MPPHGVVKKVLQTRKEKKIDGVNRTAFNPKDGFCYVTSHDYVIRKISPQGVISAFAEYEHEDKNGLLTRNSNIAINHVSGDVYISDSDNNRIRKITPEGAVATIARSSVKGYLDSYGEKALFDYPWGIAINQQDGCIYIADQGNRKIRKITPHGTVTTFPPRIKDGNPTFLDRSGICIDPTTSDVYVADSYKILKISPEGEVSTFAGTGVHGCIDGECLSATFNSLVSIKVVEDGCLLVGEYIPHNIRKIKQGKVSTITHLIKDSRSYRLTKPYSIEIDLHGTYYIAIQGEIKRVHIW